MTFFSEQTTALVYQEIRRILNNSQLNLSPSTDLMNDLSMDSLNIAEISAFIARYHKTSRPIFYTVGDVLQIIEDASKPSKAQSKTASWPKETQRRLPQTCTGPTLAHAFLQLCNRMGNCVALGDDFSGIFTYKKMKRSALVLAEYFKSYHETRIAILLPASTSAYVVIFAMQLAQKVPVMLNWTLGPRYLEQMMAQSESQTVITSAAFIQRLSHVNFGTLVQQFVFLEQIIKSIPWWKKLRGLFFKSPLPVGNEHSPAVILFTSGTEGIPKAVPLSHKNLLEHHRAVAKSYPVDQVRASFSHLPPFHSLGFSVTGISLILLGIKTAFHPNPADGPATAEGIQRWDISHYWTAPTFLRKVLATATAEQLASLKVVFCGGETVPLSLETELKALNPNTKIIEGYGVSECSPAIALGSSEGPKKGVGKIFPCLELITVHAETKQPLPKGTEGEICVCGPTVFNGYLRQTTNPFIEFEGKKWFKTGDLGYVDSEGYLHLLGRISRFTKIGAEMISLNAIERALAETFQKKYLTPPPTYVICSYGEHLGNPRLILFTNADLSLQDANNLLKLSGLSNLIQLAAVEKTDEFPEIGIGKLDYRRLLMNSKYIKNYSDFSLV